MHQSPQQHHNGQYLRWVGIAQTSLKTDPQTAVKFGRIDDKNSKTFELFNCGVEHPLALHTGLNLEVLGDINPKLQYPPYGFKTPPKQ